MRAQSMNVPKQWEHTQSDILVSSWSHGFYAPWQNTGTSIYSAPYAEGMSKMLR